MIEGVPSNLAHLVWDKVAPMLKRVTEKYDPGYDTDDILEAIKSQRMQLWIVGDGKIDAVIVTEIQIYPRYKCLHAPYIAGENMGAWFTPAFEMLEAYAKHYECKYLTGCGRRGWFRQGSDRGYKEDMTIVRKQL